MMHTITIANRKGAAYEVDPRRPLLDSLRDQGVDLPMAANMAAASPVQPN